VQPQLDQSAGTHFALVKPTINTTETTWPAQKNRKEVKLQP